MSEIENNNIVYDSNGKSTGTGALIGTIIIIVVLIAGGWYFVSSRMDKINQQNSAVNEATTTFSTSTLSTSTEIVDIQKDLDSVNLDTLGQ